MGSLLEDFKGKDIFIISHNDLDGVGAIIVYKYYVEPYTNKSYIFSGGHDEIDTLELDAFNEYNLILFTDIAPTEELYNVLIKLGKEVKVFDHHQSSYNTLLNVIKEEDYYYSTEKCGTKIFFDELTKGRRTTKCVHQFCELVDTYDRWQEYSALWKDGKALHNILWGSVNWSATNNLDKYEKFIINQLEKMKKGKNFYLTAYENKLALAAEDKEREFYIKAKRDMSFRVDNEGNNYAYFECPSKTSLIANRLLKDYSQLKYIVGRGTYEDKEGTYDNSLSLRSLGETDVSIIAGLHGGGGHHNSSGCSIDDYEKFLQFKSGKIHLI